MSEEFFARVGRFFKLGNGSSVAARLTAQGSIASANVEPPLAEAARAGKRFHGGLQLAANGIAPDATLPTTTAKVALYNANAEGGRSLFIDHLTYFQVSGTPAAGATLWACVSKGPLATPVAAMATGFNVASSSGQGSSMALWGTAVTLPAGTVWFSVGSVLQLAAANFGQGAPAFELKGGLLIPPRYAMGLAILSGTGATPLYAPNAAWSEFEADLEY